MVSSQKENKRKKMSKKVENLINKLAMTPGEASSVAGDVYQKVNKESRVKALALKGIKYIKKNPKAAAAMVGSALVAGGGLALLPKKDNKK